MTRLGMDGELGNQLFQYAMLRSVAARRGFDLRIIKRYTGTKKQDLVELEPFSIEAPALLDSEITDRTLPHHFYESCFNFNGNVFCQLDGTDYHGYFQSEQYFEDIEPIIRREFRFNDLIAKYASDFIGKIRILVDGRSIVSLHVRRGDYLDVSEKHRILPLQYYRDALDQFARDDVAVLVFSDDTEWCYENLGIPHAHFCVSRNHWCDLAIMAACDHHIIANSSYSWWGAWLNPSSTKQVIAPTPWLGPAVDLDTKDLVPKRWTQIKC